jgi:GTP cyclohydrolase I
MSVPCPVEEAAAHVFNMIWCEGQYDFVDGRHHADTPRRWVKMMREMTTPEEFNFTTFATESDEMVVVKDIPFVSMCAHHMLPFVGTCHIGYVPNRKLAGLSKFPRLVNYHSRALTVQEELTQKIALDLMAKLDPVGVAVYMDAVHTCMTIRGVKSSGSSTITSKMTGCFADHTKLARAEFLSAIK